MTSKKQKEHGWLIPDPIKEYPTICAVVRLPNHPLYRQAFLGAIQELGKWYNWEKSYTPGDTRATETAAYMREFLLETCMTAVCPIDLRQNPLNPCEIQKTYDGETWETAWFNDLCQVPIDPGIMQMLNLLQQQQLEALYNGTPSSVNPNAPDDSFANNPTRRTALCIALKAWVGSVVHAYMQRAGIALGLSGLVIGLLGFFGPFGIAAGLVLGGSLGLISLIGFNAAQDETAIDDIVCCMYEALTGQPISHAEFELALDNCNFTPGDNNAILRDIVAAELPSEGNYVAFLNVLGDSFLLSQAGVACEVNCDCPGWDYVWASEPNIGDWVAATLTEFPAGNQFTGNANQQGYTFDLTGGQIVGGGYSTTDITTAGILEIDVQGCAITLVAVTIRFTATTGNAGVNVGGYIDGAWELIGGFATGAGGWVGGAQRMTMSMNVPNVEKIAIFANGPVQSFIDRIEIFTA